MAALLDAVRRVQPNGFTLFDSCKRLPIGREPPPAVALAMAERLVEEYSSSWPVEVRAVVTASRLVKELTSDGLDSTFSARPALMAYVLDLVGDAHKGTGEQVFAAALNAAAIKLVQESSADTARLLHRMDAADRVVLRKLADGTLCSNAEPHGTVEDELVKRFPSEANVGKLAAALCEADWPPRLSAPCGKFVRSMVEAEGGLISCSYEGDRLVLLPAAHANLTFIADRELEIPDAAKDAAARAALQVLVNHGLGVVGKNRSLQVPRTLAGLLSIPPIVAVADALEAAGRLQAADRQRKQERMAAEQQHKQQHQDAAQQRKQKDAAQQRKQQDAAQQQQKPRPFKSPHVGKLVSLTASESLGWWLLTALRHLDAHVYFRVPHVLRNGLTASVVTAVVRAAATAILEHSDGRIEFAADDVLMFKGESHSVLPRVAKLLAEPSRSSVSQ